MLTVALRARRSGITSRRLDRGNGVNEQSQLSCSAQTGRRESARECGGEPDPATGLNRWNIVPGVLTRVLAKHSMLGRGTALFFVERLSVRRMPERDRELSDA